MFCRAGTTPTFLTASEDGSVRRLVTTTAAATPIAANGQISLAAAPATPAASVTLSPESGVTVSLSTSSSALPQMPEKTMIAAAAAAAVPAVEVKPINDDDKAAAATVVAAAAAAAAAADEEPGAKKPKLDETIEAAAVAVVGEQ